MLTDSQVRKNWDKILEQISTNGGRVEFEHNGIPFQITKIDPQDKLARLVSRAETVIGDPEDLVHMDWSGEARLDLP